MSRLSVRTALLDAPARLLQWVPDRDAFAWLHGEEGLVAWGEAVRLDAGTGPDRFRHAARAFAEIAAAAEVDDEVVAPGTGLVAFGTFTFDPRSHGSVLVIPSVVVGERDGRAWMTVVGEPPFELLGDIVPPTSPDRIRFAGSSMPDLHWLDAVAGVLRYIDAGDVAKVVLARDYAVWSKAPFDPRVLVARLSSRFPECFTFLCDGLVGATPELLARRMGGRVESLVLAGSARRGEDASSDAAAGEELLASKKDRVEHELAVASVREGLARCCADVAVDHEPSLLRLANVQHLATRLRAELTGPATALDLAGFLHPTAAVCGTPTDDALALIRALEGMDRGRYAGPVGWVDARGDGEWGIALRCAELSGARARLFAGAGIVAGSLPESELEETRLKLRAMQSAFEA